MTDAILCELQTRARALWGNDITPCAGKSWRQSVTREFGRWLLWFNVASGSTRITTLSAADARRLEDA